MGWLKQAGAKLLGPVDIAERGGVPVSLTLTEVLERHEIIDVATSAEGGPYVIVGSNPPPTGFELVQQNTVRLADTDTTPDLRELGVQGSTVYSNVMRQDYNPDMQIPRCYGTYDQMRRSDADVRGSLRVAKTPVLAARWFIEPVRQKDGTVRPKDQMIADFIWMNLTEWMSITWEQVLFEAMLQLDFGYYMFEKVFEYRLYHGQPKLYWKKLMPLHPMDVVNWEYDTHGGPRLVRMTHPDYAEGIPIHISKLLVFTFDKEGGNMEGLSVLRSAYKHWYYKENLYKIDAIQKERHGIGVPVIKLPVGFKNEDKNLAHEMGRNLRTNEKAHIVLPPNWELIFAQLSGHPVNAIESIEHHGRAIYSNVLAEFMHASVNANAGGAEAQKDLFMKSCRFIVENIRGTFNKFGIPQLVNYNWANVEQYPQLKARRVGDTVDWRAISFAIRNFIGAGVLRPDDKLEEWVRNEMDLPNVDLGSIREVSTPQAVGARVGPPRQSTAAGMKEQAKGTGKANTGSDNSGS